MAFSTTKQIDREQSKARVKDLLTEALFYVSRVSKGRVTVRHILSKVGDLADLTDLPLLQELEEPFGTVFAYPTDKLTANKLRHMLSRLETL